MAVVEYKLHLVGRNMHTPDFIVDGGYWLSPIDHTLVGWVLPESEREYYVPDTLVELGKQDLIDRMLAIHAVSPLQKQTGTEPGTFGTSVDMTEEEVVERVSVWYDQFTAR